MVPATRTPESKPKQESAVTPKSNAVLVIGGGVAGLKAATNLAQAGISVILTEQTPAIGGYLHQLDRTFPTNNCDICTLAPDLERHTREAAIKIMTMTEVKGVVGEPGAFSAYLATVPRYINLDNCTACGKCLSVCPEKAVRLSPGFDLRAETCLRYPRSIPMAYSIDMKRCTKCGLCVDACPVSAIDLAETPQETKVQVGSVILACGGELFNPGPISAYGYGRLANVVTGLEFEQLLTASGPTQGRLIRPSDQKLPGKVAWIQCVGSRNFHPAGNSYCSSVCCMYAVKEATLARERCLPDLATTIFYMDMRTCGKGYEAYYRQAEEKHHIRFIRARPGAIEEDDLTKDLSITYEDDAGDLATETFDMVVLANGFQSAPHFAALAKNLGVSLDSHGFVETNLLAQTASSRPGIYVCGVAQSPKDIPESIVQAAAAACQAARHMPTPHELPPSDKNPVSERGVNGEPPRVGVFVCECAGEINDVIDTVALYDYARKLPQVVAGSVLTFGCSPDGLQIIAEVIAKSDLNRVVLAACSPRSYGPLFKNVLRQAGINNNFIELANIREQAAWVDMEDKPATSQKAKDLLRMAVARVSQAIPVTHQTRRIAQNALVVGGGPAGMNAALSLADLGIQVYLVEKSDKLGGQAGMILRSLAGDDIQKYLTKLIDRVESHDRIKVYPEARVVQFAGESGTFRSVIETDDTGRVVLEHGAVIIASGAQPKRPSGYRYDQSPAVLTQMELEDILINQPDRAGQLHHVVMIQCADSRTPEDPDCNRICCTKAVKNALLLKQLNPQARIMVLNRDIRTYGFYEDYYQAAREQGVLFVHYTPDQKPEVLPFGDKVLVTFRDTILGRDIIIEADVLALSVGMKPQLENMDELTGVFRLPLTAEGYFLEDHIKLRPVQLPHPGMFVCGTAHSPKDIGESITQALAAAGEAYALLAEGIVEEVTGPAYVTPGLCAACLTCVRACPYHVPYIREGASYIDPAECRGCGVCVTECPAKAIQLPSLTDDQLTAQVEALLE
ncbi:MAG: CoB--CoM heterodisulfide reductase iron-sulfur subunit A family protein [Deltaproteobacteria bacterium]|nr:CoB--CoM heterodisulfide reductase iron-sulfur subunit A family protein [Deltaproteobacteria bacterium]